MDSNIGQHRQIAASKTKVGLKKWHIIVPLAACMLGTACIFQARADEAGTAMKEQIKYSQKQAAQAKQAEQIVDAKKYPFVNRFLSRVHINALQAYMLESFGKGADMDNNDCCRLLYHNEDIYPTLTIVRHEKVRDMFDNMTDIEGNDVTYRFEDGKIVVRVERPCDEIHLVLDKQLEKNSGVCLAEEIKKFVGGDECFYEFVWDSATDKKGKRISVQKVRAITIIIYKDSKV
jgi:hypothetical protein